MMVCTGHVVPDPAWAMKKHRHPFHELIVVVRGAMTVQMEGQEIHARDGSILFYPQGVWHREWSDPADPVETFFVAWHGPRVAWASPRYDTRGRVRSIVAWLYEERFSRVEGIETIQEAYLQALLAELGRLARTPEPESLIHVVHQFLQDHLAEPLLLDDLAKRFNLSKFHFIRKYKRLSGRTPIQDLQALRMEGVRDLLMTTDLPLKTIAARTGLCNEYYLCRLFKRHFNTTPRSFRGKSSAAHVVSGPTPFAPAAFDLPRKQPGRNQREGPNHSCK